ncbi:hypothetical protein [Emticicia sp. C21]|uniref:hypothetical protein n=1 Tax=Emticicia sp. C21 TaxID=2302915 RepID=UPI000E342355|nr:hypothetical protein [Emticicia sp. C21]RFS17340.1 hypothetical protein D0T08_06055 [Emticicia sp. C21]
MELEIIIECEYNKIQEIKSKLESLPEVKNYRIIQNDAIIPVFLNRGTYGQIDIVEIVISLILTEIGEHAYKHLKQMIKSALKDKNVKIKSSKKKKK